jgi:phage gp29-like protein
MTSEVDKLIVQMQNVADAGDRLAQYLALLPPTEKYLASIGVRGFEVLYRIANEPFVAGCISARKSPVLSRDWEIQGNHADEIQQWLSRLNLNQLFSQILDTIFFGFQVFEINWNENFEPVEIIQRPPENFRIKQGQLVYVGGGGEQVFPEEKFLVCKFGDTLREQYGQALLTKIFWYWEFLRMAIKVWVKYVEKFGIPVADVSTTMPREEMQNLGLDLSAMVSEGIVVHDPNTTIQYIVSNAGQIDSIEKLIEECKKAIAVAILGHERAVTTTEGKLGNEWGAIQTREDITNADCRFIEAQMETLIGYWMRFHYPAETNRPFFVFREPSALNLDRAKRDQILAQIGVPFSPEYWKKNYDLADEDVLFEKTEFSKLRKNQLSAVFKQQRLLDAFFDLGNETLPPITKQAIEKIKSWLNGKTSLEDALQNVQELLPELPTKQFLDTFQNLVDLAMFVGFANLKE